MNSKIQKAVESLAEKASTTAEAHHAMNFAQAALNLAHAAQVIEKIDKK